MRRWIFGFVALFFSMLASGPAAHAGKRVALAIGNGDYGRFGKLPNPSRDAAAMEALLRAAGFDAVAVKQDLGRDAMRRALRDFADQVSDADIAVVFYAGHGIEVNGSNYLIPVDAALERDIDVEDETVPLERVSQVVEAAKRLRLIILDACRENPSARSMRRTIASRSIGRGLAKVEVLTSDTLIAYAARAGSTAADGVGANSPYTMALVKHLATPGLDLRLAFGRVRDEVLRTTHGAQEPYVYGSLGGAEMPLVPGGPTFAVPPPPTVATPPSVPSADSEAERAWAAVKDTTSIAQLEVVATRYKGTVYADLARARIDELRKQQTALAAPPPATPKKPSEESWQNLLPCEGSKPHEVPSGSAMGSIGSRLDARDRQLVRKAEYDAWEFGASGRPVRWNNSNSGRCGEIVPGPFYDSLGKRCRDFAHRFWTGKRERMNGTACRNDDATWTQVK
jgi:surface antigen